MQGLLYRYEEETWLGIARLAMGYPLVGVALLGTIWAVRRARRAPLARRLNEPQRLEPDRRACRPVSGPGRRGSPPRPPASRRTAARRPPPARRRPAGRSRVRRAGSSPARSRCGSFSARTGAPASGVCAGQRDLHEVGLALPQRHQPHQVAHRDRLLDQRREQARGGDRDVDAPVVVEQPLVARVVHPGDDPAHRELGLGQQRHHEVDLVVAGGRDHDVAALQAGLLQRGELAGVGVHPLGGLDRLGLDVGRALAR